MCVGVVSIPIKLCFACYLLDVCSFRFDNFFSLLLCVHNFSSAPIVPLCHQSIFINSYFVYFALGKHNTNGPIFNAWLIVSHWARLNAAVILALHINRCVFHLHNQKRCSLKLQYLNRLFVVQYDWLECCEKKMSHSSCDWTFICDIGISFWDRFKQYIFFLFDKKQSNEGIKC